MKKYLIILLAFINIACFAQKKIVMYNGKIVTFQGRMVTTTLTAYNYTASLDANNYFTIKDNDSLTFSENGVDEPFYISIWAKLNNRSTGLFAKVQEYQLRALTNGIILCDIYDSTQAATIGRQSNTSVMGSKWNNWAHYVLTYNGNGATTGIDIYVDGVAVDVSNRGSGTYNYMGNRTTNLEIGRVDGTYKVEGQILDFRIGKRFLDVNGVDSLYNHYILGDEIAMIPFTDGTGTYATNVTPDNNIVYAAKSVNDVTDIRWDSTQTFWDYNNTYGFTRVTASGDEWIFPYLNTGAQSFTSLDGYLLWGQSNAGGLAVTDSLTGTEYENASNENMSFGIFDIAQLIVEPYWLGQNGIGSAANFGMDMLLGWNYKEAEKESFVLKYSVGSTALDSLGPSTQDWNPNSQQIYKTAKDTSILGLIDIFERGRNPYINSFVWIQGEQDATVLVQAQDYQNNLNLLYDSVTNIFQTDVNMQLVMLGDQYTGTYQDTVRKYQTAFAVENTATVDTINTDAATYVSCCTHYDDETYIWMADTVYNRRNNITLPASDSWLYKYFDNLKITNSK